MVVGEVRADDDERLVAAKERVEHLGHLPRRGVAGHQRHQREVTQYDLKEGQLHLQAVFELVGGVQHAHLGQLERTGHGFLVELDAAQRRGEGAGIGQRETMERHPVGGSHQHDTSHHAPGRREPRVGAGRDRARVHVARVRRDQRLGRRIRW